MANKNIVLVASVSILQNNKVLMIQEKKASALNKWNFPSGRIEPREDLLAAARREVKEETGYDVELCEASGVYNFISDTNDQVILFHFTGAILGGSLILDDAEIIDCKWVPIDELLKMNDVELRNPNLIKQIGESLVNQTFYPLTIYKDKCF